MSDNNNGGGYLTGFMAGAVVGAAVALLCAPRSGKETRDLLSRKGRELTDKTKDALEKGKEAVLEGAEEVKKLAGMKGQSKHG